MAKVVFMISVGRFGGDRFSVDSGLSYVPREYQLIRECLHFGSLMLPLCRCVRGNKVRDGLHAVSMTIATERGCKC